MISERKMEQIVVALIDRFDIKKKIGYRATIMKSYDLYKDKNMEDLLTELIMITAQYKKEEMDECTIQ